MRLFRLVAALGFFSIVGHAHAIATSPSCALTDRAYERRVCMRIQRLNSQLSGHSLANPSLTGSTAVPKPKPLPADYVDAGVTLRTNGKTFTVTAIRRLSPADVAGLKPGDEILELDGQPVKSSLGIAGLTRALGGSDGTSVTVEIGRRNVGLLTLTILRAKAVLEDYVAEMDGRTAYIGIRTFSKDAVARTRDFLERQGAAKNPRAVIIDLRDNPGGNLDDVRAFLGLFIDNRTVVARLQTKDAYLAVLSSGRPALPTDTKLVLLVTKGAPPAVALTVGALKWSAGKRLTVIQDSASQHRYGGVPLRIPGGKPGLVRDFTPPTDALLSLDADERVYLDADFVDRTSDEKDPAGTGDDPDLDRARDIAAE